MFVFLLERGKGLTENYKMEVMNGENGSSGVKKFVGSNYKYWKMCLEAYLQGQELCEIVSGVETEPENTQTNAELRRKWKIKCGKVLFALRTSISREYCCPVALTIVEGGVEYNCADKSN